MASFAAANADEWGDVAGAGLKIWRIENLKPVAVAADTHGQFHVGDAYILLHTSADLKRRALHYWLGAECSQDEAGACAYKVCELDALTGGSAVQHREAQGHESGAFEALFKGRAGGIEYLPGGVASGFTKVERDVYETRLLHLKGKRTVRVTPVACARASLNDGDAFILDAGLRLYLWNGISANRYEKAKALQVVTKLRNERGARPVVTVMDDDPDNADFWEKLGGQGPIADATSDDAHPHAPLKLYRVSDASGTVTATEEGTAPLDKASLDSGDVFVVDNGSELFVWVGKGCSKEERDHSAALAEGFLSDAGRPSWTPVTRVIEGGEPATFKSLFVSWEPPRAAIDFSAAPSAGGVAAARENRSRSAVAKDALAGGGGGAGAADVQAETMVDDGSGTVTQYRIEDFEKVQVPDAQVGQFYAGDSYIVHYAYEDDRGRKRDILYFWQGKASSTDEKACSALLTKDMDDAMGGAPTQVRVTQGKEPAHFCSIFDAHMIVHSGGKGSSFKNREEKDSYDVDGVSLYHIKGTNAHNTRAVQVDEAAGSLNSGDCFVLLTPATLYAWHGSGANEAERAAADGVASLLKGDRALESLAEGDEPGPFWEALGGKGEYADHRALAVAPRDARLFCLSNVSGAFDSEEVFAFTQEDLCDDDVMLLDTFTSLFLWVGSGSNAEEQELGLETCVKYMQYATDGRDPDGPIVVIRAGNEPPMFTCHFHAWDAAAASAFVDPYEARLAEMRKEQQQQNGGGDGNAGGGGDDAAAAAEEPAKPRANTLTGTYTASSAAARVSRGSFVDAASVSLSHQQLSAKGSAEQHGLDPAKKESYLDDGAFEALFGMPKDKFYAQPKWKQQSQKKKHGLF